jgi:hypothetical protein
MLVLMVFQMQEEPEHLGGIGLSLWATDIAAACTKLFFRSVDVKFMAAELVGGLVILFLAGIFGWSGTSAAFAVITRALVFGVFRQHFAGKKWECMWMTPLGVARHRT